MKNSLLVTDADNVKILGPRLIIILTLLFLIFGGIGTWIEARSAENFMRNVMMSEAQMLAKALDVPMLSRLSGTESDVQSPDYQYLRAQLIRIREANPRYRYLYLMGQRSESVPFFFMGTAPENSPDYTPPGTAYYEDSPTLKTVFSMKQGMVSPPFSDRWGTWISALIPISNTETGDLIAVFGMDFDASDWRMYVLYRLITPITITCFMIILLLAIIAIIRQQQSRRQNEALSDIAIELENTRLLLESIIEQSPVAMVVFRKRDSTLQYLNRAMRELIGAGNESSYIGLSLVEVKERRSWRYFMPDDQEIELDEMPVAQALFGKSVEGIEVCFLRADQSRRWVLASGVPIQDRFGNIIAAFGVYTDITEIKKAEEEQGKLEEKLRQAQKMEAVGQLAGGIAHDFNNLLQVILGYLDLLLSGPEEATNYRDDLVAIHQAAQRAANLTRQLLTFSRRQPMKPRLLDINELIQEILKMISRLIGEQIHLDFQPAKEAHCILADRGMMEQVIMNLCINSRDAMPNGGKLMIETKNFLIDEEYCQAHHWATPGRYLQLSVSDTGTGMDKETLSRIFEPFFTNKGVGKGTGLGLSTVYGIVQLHKGLINVYSEPGFGTRFNLYFPVSDKQTKVEEHFNDDSAIGGHETVLLVEDDESVRNLGEKFLLSAGYSVLLAKDGQDALNVFAENPEEIQLLIMDMIMPKMSGQVTYEKIQEIKPGVPALFTSGYSLDALKNSLDPDPELILVQKPFSRQELLIAIRRILDRLDKVEADK